MPEPAADGKKKPSFLETVPGFITAIAALITSLAALINALYTAKVIGQEDPAKKEAAAAQRSASKPPKETPPEKQVEQQAERANSFAEVPAKEPAGAARFNQDDILTAAVNTEPRDADKPLPETLETLAGSQMRRQGSVAEAAEREPAQYFKQSDTMSDPATGMEFVAIPGGCFMMGSLPNEKDRNENEGPAHKVCLHDFWIGKYEVTQEQWEKIAGGNPSYFKKGGSYPVESVSWNDVQEFISKLNSKSGKRYRLPTEAEWEYACRANAPGAYCGGDDIDALAWYGENSKDSTNPVGGRRRNAFGLHEMSGNVWEWCSDWYGKEYYASSPKDNPPGPESGGNRILRGGSYFDNPLHCRAVNRNDHTPETRDGSIGFRLVLSVQTGRR